MKRSRAEPSVGGAGVNIVRLNVGGEIFTSSRSTLQAVPSSLLGKMFEDESPYGVLPVDEDGNIFLDRDPEAFRWVLNFLRNRGVAAKPPETDSMLARVRDEADYFGLTDMVRALDKAALARKREAQAARSDAQAHNATLIQITGYLQQLVSNTNSVREATELAAENIGEVKEAIETNVEPMEQIGSELGKIRRELKMGRQAQRRELLPLVLGPITSSDWSRDQKEKDRSFRELQKLASEGFAVANSSPMTHSNGSVYSLFIMERHMPGEEDADCTSAFSDELPRDLWHTPKSWEEEDAKEGAGAEAAYAINAA